MSCFKSSRQSTYVARSIDIVFVLFVLYHSYNFFRACICCEHRTMKLNIRTPHQCHMWQQEHCCAEDMLAAAASMCCLPAADSLQCAHCTQRRRNLGACLRRRPPCQVTYAHYSCNVYCVCCVCVSVCVCVEREREREREN